MTEFEIYLKDKKIDAEKFKELEHSLYIKLESEFLEMSIANFNQQKLFLINPIRRKYQLEKSDDININNNHK